MGRLSDAMLGDDLFDADEALRRKDVGLKLVESNNLEFSAAIFAFIMALPYGWRGTAEDIRRLYGARLPQPKHHNAWGSVCSTALRHNLLIRTGNRLRMTAVKSHGRRTDEYERRR